MPLLNPHFDDLRTEYIFPIIEQKLESLKAKAGQVINLGIGDVALPLVPKIISTICEATQEMGIKERMRGYGPSTGYNFLKEAIAAHDYASLNISPDEIFISDGINSDAVNIQDLFSPEITIAICNPTYPAYLDASLMNGRKSQITFLPLKEENRFSPALPETPVDLVYLCSPNNPIGTAMTKKELKTWVDWARKNSAILVYDNAYMAFITSPDVPKSIFEIEGAKEVAIELRSFSKTAGFTGLRCGYCVLPKSVKGLLNGKLVPLHPLWTRRQNVKSNGVAYPIQKGALAVYTPEGQKQTKEQIQVYLSAGKILREGLLEQGHSVYGGHDAPYLWWKVTEGLTSWQFFDLLLEQCQILGIPGIGFGSAGEGYIRLSCFTTPEIAQEAVLRIYAIESNAVL
ncbi:MAG TPA: LL-diaminopimelate aminotransferase [Rhabdochlamydiaceae bacterium]|nr:LL-diaminopimelate aminotransferase [Rhabdochlamydiaceae bacterium]